MTRERLLHNWEVALWTGGAVFTALVIATLIFRLLRSTNRIGDGLYGELIDRNRAWCYIIPSVLIPVALGPWGIRIGTVALGMLATREFFRASGSDRDPWIGRTSMIAVAVLASGCVPAEFSRAVLAGTFVILAVVGLFSCGSGKFLGQISLSGIAIVWFGLCLGTLGDFASREGGVLLVLWLIVCVEFNDVAAYIGGKLIKGPKLCPEISPGKTISGAVTALLVTTAFAGTTAGWFWQSSQAWIPFALGFVISAAGQAGDLVVSAMKRSMEIKDLGQLLPGHGGILDRCDSLILASPVTMFVVSVFPVLSL